MNRFRISFHINGLLLFSIFTLLSTNNLHCQTNTFPFDLKDSLKSIYGLDPILYNGKLYKYYSQKNIIGNQYFKNELFVQGEVTIRGNKFNNLSLNLDIFNQELLLKYNAPNGFINTIMVSKAWLEEFSIGKSKFKLCAMNNFPERIYQVIGNDSIQIYYYIKKVLNLNNAPGSSNYAYVTNKSSFIFINKSLHQYNSNRGFIKIFDKIIQPQIKKYLRSNKVKVTYASDNIMEQLINYCNSILK
ncbi:MAG: hypothetical protein HXX16_05585 [Bacteroidales bacterium]|nr:hypothetical protein [Bacteroidales bacterium]